MVKIFIFVSKLDKVSSNFSEVLNLEALSYQSGFFLSGLGNKNVTVNSLVASGFEHKYLNMLYCIYLPDCN
jgi:hypothetical protein